MLRAAVPERPRPPGAAIALVAAPAGEALPFGGGLDDEHGSPVLTVLHCALIHRNAGDHSGLLTGNIFYRIAAKRVKLATRPALRPPWFLQVLAQCYLETAIMIQNHATELLNTVYNGHIAKMEMLEVV